MNKRNLKWITWGVVALTVLIVAGMLMNTLHRPGQITLPDPNASANQTDSSTELEDNGLTVVQIQPETVQTAIATLSRPEVYQRTVTVEQFWEGGSGMYEIAVTVCGPWTRTDRTMPDRRVRHTITGAETAYIWYNNERTIYTAPVGDVSADQEQGIPTYEEILDLPVESIKTADYRSISDVNCIYVEAEDGEYLLRYWVSVDTGLLAAAEKLLEDATVYRMGSLLVNQAEPAVEDFTLPDGTVLTAS